MDKNRKANQRIMKIAAVGIMAALGSVMYYFLPEIPLFPGVSFLRFDLSDVPAVLTGHLLGIGPGVLVAVIKAALHIFNPQNFTFGIGELINAIIGGTVVICSRGFYLLFKKVIKSGLVAYYNASIITIVITVLVGIGINLLLMPLYNYIAGFDQSSFGALMTLILTAMTPMNAVKAVLLTLPWYPVIKALRKTMPFKTAEN